MNQESESDEQLRERLQKRLLLARNHKVSGAWEIDTMRRILMEVIAKPGYVTDHKVKWLFSMLFGTMTETLEVQQIQQLMISMDNQFEEVKKREIVKALENNRRFRVLTYAILAIGGVTTMTGSLGEGALEIILAILRGLGWI